MEVLLGVKIGCLLALLVFTLGCGLTPIYVKWFQMDAATGIAPTLTLSLTLSYLRPLLTSGSDSLTFLQRRRGALSVALHSFPWTSLLAGE